MRIKTALIGAAAALAAAVIPASGANAQSFSFSISSGDYYGYDGPCPPWNDSLAHHYVFTVYALDVERLPIEGRFDGRQALEVIARHTLAKGSVSGVYSLNPRVAAAIGPGAA